MRNPNLSKRPTREKLRGFVLKAADGSFMNAEGLLVASIEDAQEFTTPKAALNAAYEKHY